MKIVRVWRHAVVTEGQGGGGTASSFEHRLVCSDEQAGWTSRDVHGL